MHLPGDVSLPPQEDFLLTTHFKSRGKKQDVTCVFILCWKRDGVSTQKSGGEKTGSVIRKMQPAPAGEGFGTRTNNLYRIIIKHPGILFIAFRMKMLYCINDCSLFPGGQARP